MSNNLFNILVFLFIMVASGIYTLYFISKADIIKYHKEKGIKAIIPIVGEYTLFKNAFGKSNALLTYLLTNVLPIATYLTFCTVIKNVTIFWLIMTLPILISIYLRYRRNTVLFNKCYGFGKVSSILSLIFPKATFIFVYLFGKNYFHGHKTPMNKSKAKKIRTIASILLLTVSLNSLFGVTSNAEPLQEEGTQVTEEVIDEVTDEVIDDSLEEDTDEPVQEKVETEENVDDANDTWYTDENGHVHYHGKDLTITPDNELTEEELYYKFHFDYVQQEASPETISKIKAKRQWLINNGINQRNQNHKFHFYDYINFVDYPILSVNDPLDRLDDKYCLGLDADRTYVYYTKEGDHVIRHSGCVDCLSESHRSFPAKLEGEEDLVFFNETTSNDSINKNENNNQSDNKANESEEESKLPTNTLEDFDNYMEITNKDALKERPGFEKIFRERKIATAGLYSLLIGMNTTTDFLTSPLAGIVTNLGQNSRVAKFITKLLDIANIGIIFTIVDFIDFGVDTLLALLNYYNGNYTMNQLMQQLGNKASSLVIKKCKDLMIIPLPKSFEKFIDENVKDLITDEISGVSETIIESIIEFAVNLTNPKISE